MSRLLLFGGTTEGRELAAAAAAMGYGVTVSVATGYGADCIPETPGVTVHTGRLDAAEMARWMAEFDLVVDATHPYAVAVSANVRSAAAEAGRPYLRLVRPESEHPGCRYADSVPQAVAMVPPGNVLAATGSKEIAAYAAIPDFARRVWARVLPVESSVAACRAAGLPEDHILAGRGPFSLEDNLETMARYAIRSMVTKDGGAAGGFPEKLEAARRLGVQVLLIRRPAETGLTMAELRTRLEALVWSE